ncbi:hypothetical protein LZ31DRAFT_206351 [Colletotrichum somersetense]|nr:hypothetical protein LZ31DRAFT_206351 [Colletotrichum somersetense]
MRRQTVAGSHGHVRAVAHIWEEDRWDGITNKAQNKYHMARGKGWPLRSTGPVGARSLCFRNAFGRTTRRGGEGALLELGAISGSLLHVSDYPTRFPSLHGNKDGRVGCGDRRPIHARSAIGFWGREGEKKRKRLLSGRTSPNPRELSAARQQRHDGFFFPSSVPYNLFQTSEVRRGCLQSECRFVQPCG